MEGRQTDMKVNKNVFHLHMSEKNRIKEEADGGDKTFRYIWRTRCTFFARILNIQYATSQQAKQFVETVTSKMWN